MYLTLNCRVLVVYPRDYMTDYKLWFSAAAQHDKVSYHILLDKETIKIQISKHSFCGMYITFTYHKVKKF